MSRVFNLNRYDKIVANDLSLNGTFSSALGGIWQSSNSVIYYNGGNVGIGTTSPANKLVISGGAIQLSPYASGSTNFAMYSEGDVFQLNPRNSTGGYNGIVGLIMNSNGNVGIGTTSPEGQLHISSGNSGTCELILEADTDNNNEYDNPRIIFRQDGGLNMGIVDMSNNDLQIQTGNGDIVFYTGYSGDLSTTTEKMRILEGGDVGIGTSNPDAKLHIYDNSSRTEIFLGEDAAIDKCGILKYIQGNGSGTGVLTMGHWGDTIDTDEGLCIKKGGNVGIGTSSPVNKLEISGGAIQLSPYASGSTNFAMYSEGNVFHLNTRNSTGGYNGIVGLTMNSNGNVGIGITNPEQKLHVNGNIYLGDNDGDLQLIHCGVNIGMSSDTSIYLVADSNQTSSSAATGGHIIFGTGSNVDMNNESFSTPTSYPRHEHMRLKGTGFLGIGTTNPSHPLHVYKGNNSSSQATRRFARAHPIAHGSNLSQTTSIYANHSIGCGDFIYAVSDRRIKTNIVEINDETALNKIRLLKPCKYTYRDTLYKGTEEVIGFIAQEVLDAIPQAVKSQPGYIPNVLIMGSSIHDSSNNYIITIPDYDTSTLEVDSSGNIFSKLQISIDNGIHDREIDVNILEVISKTELKVELDTNNEGINELPNEIFIYGQFIEEKYTLIKDRIFSTGISALQEVDRQQQADKTKIVTLETQVATLESENATLKTQVADILQRLSNANL